jgi:GYF domain 2
MNPILPLFIGLFFAITCSKIARKKFKNPKTWFVLGFLFTLISLLIISFTNPQKTNITLEKKIDTSILQKDDNYWYYLDKDNKSQGPMSLNALYEKYLKKIISNNTYIWNDTMKNWKKIIDVALLKELLIK